MKSYKLKLFACAALLGVIFAPTANAENLIITTEEYAPLNFTKEDKIVGSSTELLRDALKETGIKATITIYPWARAIGMAEKDAGTCVYSTTLTPARKAKFKWAGPLVNNNWILLGTKDSPKITSLAEAKKYTIGGYKDDALTNYLKGKGMTVEEASTDASNGKKLRAGRIDFWGAYHLQGEDITKKKGYEGLVKAMDLKTVSMYLACNKSVSDATIAKLDTVLKKYGTEGKIDAAIKKYQ